MSYHLNKKTNKQIKLSDNTENNTVVATGDSNNTNYRVHINDIEQKVYRLTFICSAVWSISAWQLGWRQG